MENVLVALKAESRCPGSGQRLVSRKYIVRAIEPVDREKHALSVAAALDRGDDTEAETIRRQFEAWETEQGRARDHLVCPVCGDHLLTPTTRGTSRPHKRRQTTATWQAVMELRSQIKTLETELDRVLATLGPR